MCLAGKWQNTKTAFLCHNAVFQGRFVCEAREQKLMTLLLTHLNPLDAGVSLKPLLFLLFATGRIGSDLWCARALH